MLWYVFISSLLTYGLSFPPVTMAAITLIFAERVISVTKAEPKGTLLAALIVPEFIYGVSEGAYLVTALVKATRGSKLSSWGHL